MQKMLKFYQSFRKSQDRFFQFSRYEEAEQLFAAEKYRESIMATLNYMNDSAIARQLAIPYEANQPFPYNRVPKHFKLSHSSVVLDINLEKNFSLKVDFIKLAPEKRIPVLRQLVGLNQSTIIIPEITMKDDLVQINYSCDLDQTHPDKLITILREICHTADRYDDLFVDRFGAQLVNTPMKTNADANLIKLLHKVYDEGIQETRAAVEYYRNKNEDILAYYALYGCVYRFDYVFDLQGALGANLADFHERAMNSEWQASIDVMLKWLDTLEKVTHEKLWESAYFPHYVTSPRGQLQSEGVYRYLHDCADRIQGAKNAQDYEFITHYIGWLFYKMTYSYEIPAAEFRLISQALQQASELTWSQSADILYNTYTQLTIGYQNKMAA